MKQKKTQNANDAPKKQFRPRKQPLKQKNTISAHEYQDVKQDSIQSHHSAAIAEQPAPEYEIPAEQDNKKVLSFSRLIPNDEIIAALKKASYHIPSEILLGALPATLRGSDTLIYKSKQPDGFLIGVIPAISRIINAQDPDTRPNQPTALFLFASEASAQSAYALTNEIFKDLKIHFICTIPAIKQHDVTEHPKDETAVTENVDMLFATPKSILEAQKSDNLKLNEIKILCIHELNLFEADEKEALNTCMTSLLNDKVQKIFISYQNTPKIREFAFKYLEDPEIFSFLPPAVTEQYPRQFAHALEATKKFQVLLGYLKTYKPRAALVVANTRTVAEWIAFKLHGNGIKVSLMTGAISSYHNREKLLSSVLSGDINVFVTTDYSLKNFGIENINCVYHFDLPDNPLLYLERLNKIEGSRNPISIAFICEDYGFNMAKIEETLGFKIRLTTPDKNFFNFKDASEYPLETDGRVKIIGQSNSEPKQTRPEIRAETSTELRVEPRPQNTHRSKQRPLQEAIGSQADTQQSHAQSTQSKTTAQQTTSQQTTSHHTPTEKISQPHTSSRHHQPDTSKFVRRDERAREAIADAVLAAKLAEEKRKSRDSQKSRNVPPSAQSSAEPTSQHENMLVSLFSVLSEAIRAGVHATKESLSQNTEKKLPGLHRFLNRGKK